MKEFYYKLFTLTPESLNKKEFAGIGNQWIVHQKGAFFEQISPPLTIYANESYLAFRQNFRKTAERLIEYTAKFLFFITTWNQIILF
jgi:hypothetical protein